jgi:hypothetical protein
VVGRLGLASASAFAMLLVLEGLVRVADLGVHSRLAEMSRYGAVLEQDAGGYPRHLPGTRLWSEGVELRFNSLGMRDPEPALPKPPGRRRLLLLGDSVVLGPRVEQEQIAASRVRAALAARGVDVVTAAVAGWNTVFQEMFVAANVERVDPDAIVLVYVQNDNELTLPFDREREPPRTIRQRLYRWLVVRSRLFEWAVYVYYQRYPDWAGLSQMAEREKAKSEAGEPFAPDETGWLQSRAALAGIAEAASARNARFLVVFFRYEESALGDRILARLREFGEANDVPVVDAAPWYADREAEDFFVAPFDAHPNADGHARLARGIVEVVAPALGRSGLSSAARRMALARSPIHACVSAL